MITRDSYVAFLEKRAADAAESAIEPTDSVQLTTQEYRKNREDDRQYLNSIFPNAGEVQSNQSATVKKMFDSIPKDAIVGTPLLKVARAVFFDAVNSGRIKTASPIHAELVYRSFANELEKIANMGGLSGGALGGAVGGGAGMSMPSVPSQGVKPAAPGGGAMGKLAGLRPQTLSQVAAKNQMAMSRPAKVWDLSSPMSAGAAAAKPSLPQGSGTSVHQGGFFSRLLGR